nr:GvpL/GvpF family gas vesicle protein [Pseudonocardia sp. C8]
MVYVYAVCRDDPALPADLAGVAGGPLHTVEFGDLRAVVGLVPAADFGAGRIDELLQDLDRLAEVARAHHRVVEAVGGAVDVAPLSLATVFGDEDRVREVLGERHDEFAALLGELHGRVEWGVKAWAAQAQGPEADSGRPASGTEYLRRRRAALGAAERHTDDAVRAAGRLHDTVAAASVAARRHRVHDAALTGRREPMVLNAAYLVDAGATEQWRQVVDEADADGLLVEVTGPWVPYSFAEITTRAAS